jgi:hypothetical protein
MVILYTFGKSALSDLSGFDSDEGEITQEKNPLRSLRVLFALLPTMLAGLPNAAPKKIPTDLPGKRFTRKYLAP